MQTRRLFLALVAPLALALSSPALAADTLTLTTKYGKVAIELLPKLAPKAAERLKTLAAEKFYDGLKFHRVIPGFMAQTGDPTGTGEGGSKLPNLPAEFAGSHFTRGAVGMARTNDPNSANSQFFICTGDATFLDGKYTQVGMVTSGMRAIDALAHGTQDDNGAVAHPDVIVTMR
ncbi:MAG: peptidylprolyl isomerase [Hyphomicrobiales bacterium]|nr:peptidylprolyl isomerase [Hyphomicrobiales bacterium]MDE2016296.1 peptidylprolyl isomerase [Hyphomicrobiales bacterium]